MKREIKFAMGLILLFFGTFWQFQKFSEWKELISLKEKEFLNLQNYTEQLKKQIETIKSEKNFEKLQAIIPDSPREAETLNAILNLAQQNGFLVENFSFSLSKKENFTKTTYSLESSSDYFAFKNFLTSLQILERIPLIESFSLTTDEKEGKLKSKISFSTLSL